MGIPCTDIMKTVMLLGVALLVTAAAAVAANPTQLDEAFDSEAIAATGAELNIGIPKDLQMDAADTRTMCKDNRRICSRYINRCHNTWVQNLCPKTCGKCVGDTMTATATTTTATKPPGASKCKD